MIPSSTCSSFKKQNVLFSRYLLLYDTLKQWHRVQYPFVIVGLVCVGVWGCGWGCGCVWSSIISTFNLRGLSRFLFLVWLLLGRQGHSWTFQNEGAAKGVKWLEASLHLENSVGMGFWLREFRPQPPVYAPVLCFWVQLTTLQKAWEFPFLLNFSMGIPPK